ncbi:MAG TPA: ATP-binding protein [Caulobacteraceae bacterium]|nr:ATP-binding protein [Caulobacteraceae bacterium]
MTAIDASVALPGATRSELGSARTAACLLAALLVCVLVVASIETSRSAGLIAALWPAAGVAMVAWLKGPRTAQFDGAFALFLAAAYATGNLLVGNTGPQIAMFTVANMLEVGTAVWLVRRFNPALDLVSLRGLGRFLATAPVLAPVPAGLFASAVLAWTGKGDFLSMFQTWWFGHALGIAVIGSVALAWRTPVLLALRQPAKAAEAAALLGAFAALTWVVFYTQAAAPFLLVPLLLAISARLRVPGAAAALLIVTAVCIYATMHGYGPMHLAPGRELPEKVRLAQLYLIFACLPMLPIAALLNERDRLAEAARAGQARAEAASAGKSRLLANVSHEIKSPVAGIIGIGELWAGGKLGPVTPMQEEMSEMLVRTARQIETLATDLLDVARAEAGSVSVNLRPVDLDGVVEDVRRTVAMKPEAAGLKWIVERCDDQVVALADSVRLAQVVTNLATNAVKYGAPGGVVIFRLSRPSFDTVRLEVADKGPGIRPEKQAELFEPFNRLGMEKSTVEGHGIGLALAKRLAELQGGRMGFESAPGQGARFWIDLKAGTKP